MLPIGRAHPRFKCRSRPYTTPSITNWPDFVADFVRKHDYESYLAAPLYPTHLQNAYLALKAFSAELAMVQDTVSAPAIGQMRMQFWRDTVRNISSAPPPQQPIALGLYSVAKEPEMSSSVYRYHLKRMIDARDAELHTPVHLTVDSLTSHAEATSCTLMYLLLELVSPSTTPHGHSHSEPHSHDPELSPTLDASALAHAASHLGTAQTITTLLRALPYHAAHGRLSIPAEITAKHGLKQEDLFRAVARTHSAFNTTGIRGRADSANRRHEEVTAPCDIPGLTDAVFEFATLANDHLITARTVFEDAGGVPQKVMPVFIAGVPVASFLQRVEAVDFDIFNPKLQRRQWTLPWTMWRSSSRRAF